MSNGISVKTSAVSRIGQRRQVVIPKRVFDALKLQTGDFVEMSAEGGRLQMRPQRLVDIGDDTLSDAETLKVHRGEAELKAGLSKPWRAVKDELAG